MELLVYVKELLLLNDCVIIPGFGGFVSTYQPANISAARFTPPGKSVSFNRKLSFNDGLFINYVADKKGVSYMQAGRQTSQLADEMNYRLVDGETLNIPGIGTLVYDEHENLIFTPKIEENLNPDTFGLPAFCYETLSPASRVIKAIPQTQRDAAQVLFHKRTYRKVFVAIPLLFALAVTPIKNNLKEDLQHSDLGSLKEMMMPKNPMSGLSGFGRITEDKMVSGENAGQTLPGPDAVPASDPTDTGTEGDRYFMIGGSFREEGNARNLVEQMKHTGYPARIIGVIKGLHYVALESYPTSELARKGLRSFFAQHPGSDAWIYAQK